MSGKHYGRHFLVSVWIYFNETYHIYSIPGPHDTNDISKLNSWVQRSRSRTLFCTLPAEDTDQWFTVKDHVVILGIF